MKCVILQPSYIPWRGYFHQIQKADVFIFYDDVQYDRHGWRNRNRIKTPAGPRWLTIPIQATRKQIEETATCDVWTAGDGWKRKHFETLRHCYAKAPYFDRYRPMLERWYAGGECRLANFTIATTLDLAHELAIKDTRFLRSSTLNAQGTKTGRLLSLLQQVGATHYISGPAAQAYLDVPLLSEAGIQIEWMSYQYREYPQLHPPFDPKISTLDLLFQVGPGAGTFIWGERG
jgi:WbqC-like protein family